MYQNRTLKKFINIYFVLIIFMTINYANIEKQNNFFSYILRILKFILNLKHFSQIFITYI